MKYLFALALSLVTTAAQAVPFEALRQALFDLDLATVENLLKTNVVTPAEQARALALAEDIKTTYVPAPRFRKSGKDVLRILGGTALCAISVGSFATSSFFGTISGDNLIYGASLVAALQGTIAAASSVTGALTAFYGIRHFVRGYNAYSAKEDMRKIVSIIDLLKNAVVQA